MHSTHMATHGKGHAGGNNVLWYIYHCVLAMPAVTTMAVEHIGPSHCESQDRTPGPLWPISFMQGHIRTRYWCVQTITLCLCSCPVPIPLVEGSSVTNLRFWGHTFDTQSRLLVGRIRIAVSKTCTALYSGKCVWRPCLLQLVPKARPLSYPPIPFHGL